MWLLIMIIFNQPYNVDHIKLLGRYDNRQQCIDQQRKAVEVYNESKNVPVSFGCMQLPGTQISTINRRQK